MQTVTTETMAVPPPEPERPAAAGPGDWIHRNLFRSVGDGIVTVVSGLVVLYVVYRALRYVFVTGRWEIVQVNLKLFMVGRYPNDELWRISVAIALIAMFTGLVAGFVGHRRVVTGRAAPSTAPWWRTTLATMGRLWPLLAGVALVLSMTTTIGPWLTPGRGDHRRDPRPADRAAAPRPGRSPPRARGHRRVHRADPVPARPDRRHGLGRPDAQRVPRRRRDHPVLPAGTAAGARPPLQAPADPLALRRLHRAVPRCAAVRAAVPGVLRRPAVPAERHGQPEPRRAGHRGDDAVHRRVRRRDRPRRPAVAAARARPRRPRRSGCRPSRRWA